MSSPVDDPPERIGIREIGKHRIRTERLQLGDGMAACCNSHGPCAEGAGAGDVVRRVADDPGVAGREFHVVMRAGPLQRLRAEQIAILRVVSERPEWEIAPEVPA